MDDRMFRVLVVGGMSLVGCGGIEASRPRSDGNGQAVAGAEGDDRIVDSSSAAPTGSGAGDGGTTLAFASADATSPTDTLDPGDATALADADDEPSRFPIQSPPVAR